MADSSASTLASIFRFIVRIRWAVIEDRVVVWSGPTQALGEAWAQRHGRKIDVVLAAERDLLKAS